MVRRIARPGDLSSSAAFPTQPEASAYFARMSVWPSAAYRDAVNTAIYKWKQLGAWSSVIQLIVMAADTSQAALLDMSANAHNATITGSLTFTANKGFSGFDASNGLNFGLDPTILVDDNYTTVFAGIVNIMDGYISVIENSTNTWGSDASAPGNIATTDNGTDPAGVVPGGSTTPFWERGHFTSSSQEIAIGGSRGGLSISPTRIAATFGPPTSRRANYKTSLRTPHPLTRCLAYGAVGSAMPAATARKFFVVLHGLLETMSAFD